MRSAGGPFRRLLVMVAAAVLAVSGASMALIAGAPPASAERSPGSVVLGGTTFYAYVAAGETLNTSFVKQGNNGAGSDTQFRFTDPAGTVVYDCTVAAAAPAGTACGELGRTGPAGVWTLEVIALNGQAANWPEAGTSRFIWDITVADAGNVAPGRVWTELYRAYDFERSDFPNLGFFVVTETGAVYDVDLYDFVGVGWTFSSDAYGITDPPGSCGSAYASLSVTLNSPEHPMPAEECGDPYKLFFQTPDPGLPATAAIAGGTEWVLPQVVSPEVTGLAYEASAPGARAGVFTYNVSRFTGNYSLQLDLNGDGDYTDAIDRTIALSGTSGAQSYAWDGLDGQGNAANVCTPMNARVVIDRTDEIHFVLGDIEGLGGFSINQLRGNAPGLSTLYWDDTSIDPTGKVTTTPVLASGPDGVDSSVPGGVHGWPLAGGNTWGNQSQIDNWTFSPVDVSDELAIGTGCGTLTVVKEVAGRVAAGDQFTVSALSGASVLGSATTAGAGTSATTGELTVAEGLTYTITDALASGSASPFALYAPTISCVDSLGAPVATAAAAPAWSFTVPGTDDYTCTVTNTPTPANLAIAKTVDPADGSTVTSGQTVTYTLTFANSGGAPAAVAHDDVIAGVLDDATLASGPTSSNPALTVGPIVDGRFAISGAVPGNTTYTVSYSVTVNPQTQRGDNVLANVVVPTGGQPPAVCAAGDPLCTTNPVPRIEVAKSVDPADGSTVVAGQTLTYTLTFANTGAATGTVDFDDVISGVLDDATVASAPVASNPALAVSPLAGGRYTVTGSVPAGAAYTVTYSVTVLPDGQRGDNVLANVVVPTGGQPPAVCAAGDPLCTTNPVPRIEVAKSVDPADGSTVVAGQTLTYTLTFANTGAATGTVDFDDVISGVLDDATVASAPVASNPALAVSPLAGGRYTVTGSVPAGAAYTVSYSVTVSPAGQRGDDVLANVVVPTGGQPPAVCAAGDPLCTTNPVRHLSIDKSADTVDLPDVGDVITFTVVVTNDGAVAYTAADEPITDDLSDVLDDATYNGDVAATAGTATVTGDELEWSGALPVGGTVTITYSVTYTGEGDTLVVNTACVPAQGADAACDTEQVPGPRLVVAKSADPASGTTVTAGQTITYTLTFANQGRGGAAVDYTDYLVGVLDDATLVSGPTVSDEALAAGPVESGAFRITGVVPGGTVVTVTYQATVKPDGQRGDNVLGNVVARGATPPSDECVAGDPLCTQHPVPEILPTKTVDPASGTTVRAGDTLTYTLTFRNSGAAAGELSWVDRLTDVLDDATLTTAPAASSSDIAVASVDSEGELAITGTVPAGATYTVSYTVTVKPDAERGNNAAANFLTREGGVPSGDCVAPDCLGTYNPMPLLRDWKTVDPASGAAVAPGQTLTYTLHFVNDGKAAGEVDRVDDLSQAIDDVFLVSQPASSDPALAVTAFGPGHRAAITGTLEPGQHVTVSYQVQVRSVGELGDGVLANFLQGPDDPTPPAPTCVPSGSEPHCTSNAVLAAPPAAPATLAVTGADPLGRLALAATLAGVGALALLAGLRRRTG